MTAPITRKKDTGEAGNAGQFGSVHRGEPDIAVHADAPDAQGDPSRLTDGIAEMTEDERLVNRGEYELELHPPRPDDDPAVLARIEQTGDGDASGSSYLTDTALVTRDEATGGLRIAARFEHEFELEADVPETYAGPAISGGTVADDQEHVIVTGPLSARELRDQMNDLIAEAGARSLTETDEEVQAEYDAAVDDGADVPRPRIVPPAEKVKRRKATMRRLGLTAGRSPRAGR